MSFSVFCLFADKKNTNCLAILAIILHELMYRGADKSLVRPTSRCILFDGEKFSFDATLVIYINSTNIPPIYK